MQTKRELVIVEWLDAWQDQDNFATAHGIASTHGPMPIQTIGWLITDDAVGVSVACEQSTQDGQDVFRGRTFVPRAMVKSVTPFNLTKPRTKKKCSTENVAATTSLS
jgi:hypothetical protein